MKTKEELNNIKEELEILSGKLQDLTEDELKLVTGGCFVGEPGYPNFMDYLLTAKHSLGVTIPLDSFPKDGGNPFEKGPELR